MPSQKRISYASRWYMEELVSRIVAASGKAEDRFHFGKHVLQALGDTPDFVLQVDGGTGETETCGSVLKRTVQCANAFRSIGLQRGDVIILMAPHYLDLCIPYYAAFYLGIIVAPIDRTLKRSELAATFETDDPKLVFCQSSRAIDVLEALNDSKLVNAKVITFDVYSKPIENFMEFKEFLEKHGDGPGVAEFRPTEFDPDTIALLIPTSGTTGLPKQVVISHKNIAIACPNIWQTYTNFPTPIRQTLILSPLQWLSAIANFNTSVLFKFTRLQTSKPLDEEHASFLVNTYKPTKMIVSPTFLTGWIKQEKRSCDFTSLDTIVIGGSATSPSLIEDMKEISPITYTYSAYGLSEAFSTIFVRNSGPAASSGQPSPQFQVRLMSLDTQKDILEPNVTGELWIKGPTICKGYYKNPEATKKTITEDGWLKTGDMFYTDEHYNFYFVDRIKLLMKYKNHQISPLEIQNVIKRHPGVLDVAVTAVTDEEFGDKPVACVVRHKGAIVTAREIKDLVKDNLADTKQLRGGVIFMNAIPITATSKVDYRRLKEMAINMTRE